MVPNKIEQLKCEIEPILSKITPALTEVLQNYGLNVSEAVQVQINLNTNTDASQEALSEVQATFLHCKLTPTGWKCNQK